MNFVTLLSLLLVSEITSMNPESSYANRPFENYTSNEKKILRQLTRALEVSHSGAVKLTVSNFIIKLSEKLKLFDTPEKLCEPEKIRSNPPKYVPTKESVNMCQMNCHKKNIKYVKFLNDGITYLKKKLLQSEGEQYNDYIIFLKTLPVGQCKQEGEKIFICDCDTNYQIHMNTKFEDLLNTLGHERTSMNKTQLIVIAYLLKFHPHSAIVYLIWLFKYHGIVVKSFETTSTDSAITTSSFVTELVDPFDIEAQYGGGRETLKIHKIHDEGIFQDFDDQLFKLLFSFIDKEDKDKVNQFYDTFHSEEEFYDWFLEVQAVLTFIYLIFWN